MQYVTRAFSTVSDAYNSINPATLSGAIDILVVEDAVTGELGSSPWHVRFGKLSVLRPGEKMVRVHVNGQDMSHVLPMKVGEQGEVFFVFETDEMLPEELMTSPLVGPVDGNATPKTFQSDGFGPGNSAGPRPEQSGELSDDIEALDLNDSVHTGSSLLTTAQQSPTTTSHAFDATSSGGTTARSSLDSEKANGSPEALKRAASSPELVSDLLLPGTGLKPAATADSQATDHAQLSPNATESSELQSPDDKAAQKQPPADEGQDGPGIIGSITNAASAIGKAVTTTGTKGDRLERVGEKINGKEKEGLSESHEARHEKAGDRAKVHHDVQEATRADSLSHKFALTVGGYAGSAEPTASETQGEPLGHLDRGDLARSVGASADTPVDMTTRLQTEHSVARLSSDQASGSRRVPDGLASLGDFKEKQQDLDDAGIAPVMQAQGKLLIDTDGYKISNKDVAKVRESQDRLLEHDIHVDTEDARSRSKKFIEDILGSEEKSQELHEDLKEKQQSRKEEEEKADHEDGPHLTSLGPSETLRMTEAQRLAEEFRRNEKDDLEEAVELNLEFSANLLRSAKSETSQADARRNMTVSSGESIDGRSNKPRDSTENSVVGSEPLDAKTSPDELIPPSPGSSASAAPPIGKLDVLDGHIFRLEVEGTLHQFEMSLAAGPQWGRDNVLDKQRFEEHRISSDQFLDTPGIMRNKALVVNYNEKYLTWQNAAPVLASLAVYQKSLRHSRTSRDGQRLNLPEVFELPETKPRPDNSSSGWRKWWSRNRTASTAGLEAAQGNLGQDTRRPSHSSGQSLARPQSMDETDLWTEERARRATSVPPELEETNTPQPSLAEKRVSPVPGEKVASPTKRFAKTLRLGPEQLKHLKLNEGLNHVKFSVISSYQGTAMCEAKIFKWKDSERIVISDIDGTITKSDALGHVFTMIGRDWTHPGIAKLYTDIQKNGYKFVYLTARAIGQADATRDYLKGVLQDKYQLPPGPVIMSPDRLMASLHREVIMRKPEVFKMACLRDIQRLFGDHTAFYAGFGNRITDALSYRSVNIPSSRIFTIDTNGEVKMELLELAGYKSSYIHMTDLVDQMFPPINSHWQSEFTDLNYWRDPIANIELPDLTPPSPALSARSDGSSRLSMLRSYMPPLRRNSRSSSDSLTGGKTPTDQRSPELLPTHQARPMSPLSQSMWKASSMKDLEHDPIDLGEFRNNASGHHAGAQSLPGSLPGSPERQQSWTQSGAETGSQDDLLRDEDDEDDLEAQADDLLAAGTMEDLRAVPYL